MMKRCPGHGLRTALSLNLTAGAQANSSPLEASCFLACETTCFQKLDLKAGNQDLIHQMVTMGNQVW